ASSLQSAARNLQSTSEGYVDVGIDPTGPVGGQLLRALTQEPTFKERLDQGGSVGWVIVAVGIFGGLVALWRLIVLMGIGAKVNSQLKNVNQPNNNNPLGRVLKVAEENKNVDPETLEL